MKQHLSTAMPERYSRLEVGPVGQAARSIASGAAASIPEHEGLKNLQVATYRIAATTCMLSSADEPMHMCTVCALP